MNYLYRRGRGAKRRVMHLTAYDPLTGRPTMRALCGRDDPFDTAINVPLGCPIFCKLCAREWNRLAGAS